MLRCSAAGSAILRVVEDFPSLAVGWRVGWSGSHGLGCGLSRWWVAAAARVAVARWLGGWVAGALVVGWRAAWGYLDIFVYLVGFNSGCMFLPNHMTL